MKTIKTVWMTATGNVKYPNGIDNIEDFVKFMNEHYNSFVELEVYSEKNCVSPYFIETEIDKIFINSSTVWKMYEEEINLCTEEEYVERLKKVVNEKCVHCANFDDDGCGLDLNSHRDQINLDGECFMFEKKE